jgi:ElaB/YqjD/DUF883 family membrane-anchored ribosome-binding protein
MGEATDPIRRDIERERHELEDNLEGIEAKVQQTANQMQDRVEDVQHQVQDKVEDVQEKFRDATDWRTQFNKRPMVGLLVAFGGGALLGSMLGGDDKDRDRSGYRGGQYSYQPQYQTSQYQGYSGSDGGMHVGKQHMSSTFDNVKGALMGVAAAQLKNVLSDAVPGFADEYRQVESEKGTGSSSAQSSRSRSYDSKTSTEQPSSGESRQTIQ